MRRAYSFMVAVLLVVISSGCANFNDNIETILESSAVLEETTTIEITEDIMKTEVTSSEVSVTTDEPVIADVFISNSYPLVNINKIDNSIYSMSISVGNVEIVSDEVRFDYQRSMYRLCRVDKKVISGFFIEYSDSIDDYYSSVHSFVYSTSGEKLNISDIISDEEQFVALLESKNIHIEREDFLTLEWIFDIQGLVVFNPCEEGAVIFAYDELIGIVNSNYFLDTEQPMYGNYYYQYNSEFDFNGHIINNSYSNYFVMSFDGETFSYFENEYGDTVSVDTIPFYFITDDNRFFLFAYETDFDSDENGNSILIYKCAMLIEITNGYPEVVATIHDGPDEYESIYDIPEDILELMNFSEW